MILMADAMNILVTFLIGADRRGHPGSMTDWWAVSAAWASAVGSLAAVIAALYIAGRGWRDAAARETSAQARLIHCHTDWTTMSEEHPNMWSNVPRFVFAVRNGSDQPIYQVRILKQGIEIAMVPAGSVHHETMTRKQAQDFGFPSPMPNDRGPFPGPYPVAVEFSDAAGLRWVRDGSSVRLAPSHTPSQEDGGMRLGKARAAARGWVSQLLGKK
jgi:hypothetical protein